MFHILSSKIDFRLKTQLFIYDHLNDSLHPNAGLLSRRRVETPPTHPTVFLRPDDGDWSLGFGTSVRDSDVTSWSIRPCRVTGLQVFLTP